MKFKANIIQQKKRLAQIESAEWAFACPPNLLIVLGPRFLFFEATSLQEPIESCSAGRKVVWKDPSLPLLMSLGTSDTILNPAAPAGPHSLN